MHHLNLIHFLLITLVILFFGILTQAHPPISKALPCLQFKHRHCVRCPELTHLKEQQCYQNIDNCVHYQYGSASAVCRNLLTQKNSTRTTVSMNSHTLQSQTIGFQSSTFTSTFNTVFIQVRVSEARKDPLFIRCNDHMRRGEYSHFISRSQNPIQSVFESEYQDFKDFKILYEGSGGNMLMCLIGINIKTNLIILKSFVTIGRTQIIEDCVDYTPGMQCNRCRDGYHLDSSVNGDMRCVQDIPGCIEYLRNICTMCRGHYFLVQNKCISDCEILRDSRSLKFYGGCNVMKTGALKMEVSRDYFA